MRKGMITSLVCLLALGSMSAAAAEGEIYEVVDENGNVTYTDQRPSASAEPMNLPPLSIIQSDQPPAAETETDAAAESQDEEPSPRDLRQTFRDFRIIEPKPDETFWGTGNTVVVSWGAGQPIPPELSARLFVDGQAQDVAGSGSVTLTLDRGEHQVYAELLDIRKRRLVTTDTVTFFVKQYSANMNGSAASP